MILGKPDSGKTHLLYEYLANPDLYKSKFNDVIFVTPLNKIGGLELTGVKFYNKVFNVTWIEKTIN